MCSVAGVVLASCATPAVVPLRVTGLPAFSISVPLSNVACTTDNTCVTIGTSNLDVSPTSVGEYRTGNGRWTDLTVPSTDTSSYIQTSSCWSDGCLFVGSQSSGDLVWRYDATSSSITVETAPTGGKGVDSVSCYAAMTCAILDTTPQGSRFFTTNDGGATWSLPVTVGAAALDTASALACEPSLECLASILDSSNGVAVYVSSDGGATWSARTGFSTVTWSSLTSVTCSSRKCIGLANLNTGWRIVRTNDFGEKWSKVASLKGSILSLACTSLERCIVGGMTNFQSSVPLLATVTSGVVRDAKLKYVPSPISDVACGSKICAAIGVTTVMTLRP
jgi:hypothetical protein